MNKINSINLNKTISAKGSKKMNNKIKTLEESIQSGIKKLYSRAITMELTEYGEFSPIFEHFKNPDKSLGITDFILRITKPPKNIENHNTIRNLEVSAYKLPNDYKAERIITSGTKDDIVKALSSDNLAEEIQSALKSLSESLEDI